MVAYSFNVMFVRPIWSGRKRQTIRNKRARHARPAEQLQLYYAQRTKHCLLIGTSICEAVREISIDWRGWPLEVIVRLGVRHLDTFDELDAFAEDDGFKGIAEMREFWRVHHPTTPQFEGNVVVWGQLLERCTEGAMSVATVL